MAGHAYARLSDKNKYQQKISTYRDRRMKRKAKLVEMYGEGQSRKWPLKDKEVIKRQSQKISKWREMERFIETRKNKIIALANHVSYFTGINVKDILKTKNSYKENRSWVARGIFCKWGMENKISGVLLSEYIGGRADSASDIRMRFTRSFVKHKTNKEMWVRFKLYYKDQINNSEKNLETVD